MSIPGSASSLLLKSAAGGYQIQRSLRFNSADSAYLSRTPASAGNRKTWTFSCWVKRTKFATRMSLISNDDVTNGLYFELFSDDTISISDVSGASIFQWRLQTTAVYRDPSAWMHVVFAFDTTQATSSNRAKLYINGYQVTTFGTASYPTLNYDGYLNQAVLHSIGRLDAGYFFLDAYLADIHFCDGTAYDASAFGEFDTNGIWQPKAFSGSYGSQGWKLDFADNSAATATTLGKDSSGNGNNWTPSNLSVTAGAGNDSLVDSPTNYGTDTGVGGEVRGNYCTLNPLISTSSTLSNGNLDYASTATYQSSYGTIAARTGKWYCEGTVGSFVTDATIGVSAAPFSTTTYVGGSATSWGYEGAVGRIYNNAGFSAYGATFGAGDTIGVAFDADSGKLWFAKNGTWQASGNPATGTNPAVTLSAGIDYLFGVAAGNGGTWSCNFGQRPFAYTAPSGFKALCTANLPAPTITKGSSYFDTVLYTGTGSSLTPTSSLGFSPDLVWIKGRSGTTGHALYDTVRGAKLHLVSNSAAAETTYNTGLTAFNSNGFTVGTLGNLNTNAETYAAWTWDAGSSTVTNTTGTISSQVRANASSGFSVVSYTGSGANATIGHGLGVAPSFIIVKARGNSYNWQCYHSSLGAAFGIQLNLTNASAAETTFWNSTSPTSTVFSVGTSVGTNQSSATYIAYCFAPVAGYSAFGSYTGNGSADGSFVYLGFRPAVVIVKMSSSAGNWTILDVKRASYNVDNDPLYPNLSNAEGTTDLIDITSNGFKVRTTDATFNTNAGTYIYAAWAENPFSLARAR